MMAYKHYKELIADIKYSNELVRELDDDLHDKIKLSKMWGERIKQKYEYTKKSNTTMGKFLKMYPLTLREFRTLVELMNDHNETRFGFDTRKEFLNHGIIYGRSNLRKFKLIFRIRNPKTPMVTEYVVSYRAQLALMNKKYTSEYEELDMAMEEESNRSLDGMDTLYYTFKPKVKFKDLIVDDKIKQDLLSCFGLYALKDLEIASVGTRPNTRYGIRMDRSKIEIVY